MPMKRERQWDMFDVATGACGLDDYLFQRYSENDLMSKFWVEKTDHVDELRKPPEGSESKEQIVIPIQGPRAGTPAPAPQPVSTEPLPSRPPWEAAPAEPLPSRPSWEAAQPSAVPAPPPAVAAPERSYSPPAPPIPQAPPQQAPPPPLAAPAAPARPVPPPPVDDSPAVELSPVPEPPAPPSMEELLARFHQAAKAYEERAKDELPPGSEASPE